MHIVAGARVVKSQNSEVVASAKRHKAGPQRLGCRDAEEQIGTPEKCCAHVLYFIVQVSRGDDNRTKSCPYLALEQARGSKDVSQSGFVTRNAL